MSPPVLCKVHAELLLWCAVTRRPCAGEPAFPSGDNLGANENGSAHTEAQEGSSQPQAPANGAANGVEHTTAADIAASYPVGKGVSDKVVLTALHNEIPLDQFTVPRLWYELKVRKFCWLSPQPASHLFILDADKGL